MRLTRLCLALWVSLGICVAQRDWTPKNPKEVILQAATKVPKCSMGCVLPVLNELHCKPNDFTDFVICLCSNIHVMKNTSQCAGNHCTMRELKQSDDAIQTMCAGAPIVTNQMQIYTITCFFSVLVTIFVALRCYSNYRISKKVWWDDGFLFIATLFFLGYQSLTIWGTSYGFGLHIWTINTSHWSGLLFFEWLWEIIYVVVQTMTKVSILLLYYRIFPQQTFRRILFILVGALFIHFVVFSSLIITACKPINAFWNKLIDGKCLDTRLIGLIGSACSILEDVVSLCLPIPLIWRLRLRISRKIGITLILTIGVVACVATMVRFRYLYKYNQTFDQSWDDFPMTILSQVELSLSIICVCFPAIRLLFRRKKGENDDLDDEKAMTHRSGTRLLWEKLRAGAAKFGCCNPVSHRDGREGADPQSSPKATSALSQTANPIQPESRSILKKLFPFLKNHSYYVPFTMPWISSRAPQLSSIYITSPHIELSEKDPSRLNSDNKGYETQITTFDQSEKTIISQTNGKLGTQTSDTQVDRFGNLVPPLPKPNETIDEKINKNE